jgi:phenylacetate-coenzyme A ligase PaaK-like adenylate-forming protein
METGFYPGLFRSAVLPALDVLNGTRVSKVHGFLEQSQWLDRDRLVELQGRKLAGILKWTQEHSGFYRRFWKEAPPERRAASRYPELDGLPVVTKEDLRGRAGEFPLPSHRGRMVTVKSSGSTGEPMTYYRSMEQESWFWALRMRMWQWGGYVPGEPYLTLNLNPRLRWKKRLQDVIFRCSYHGFNANHADVEAVLRDLRGKKVRTLVGYASSLYLLSQAMLRTGAAAPTVRGILATGDSLFPSYRETIEKAFGVGVTDYYGAGGEGFHLASQCEKRGLYHLHLENSVIEFLRNGKPAAPGEAGEVVVTQLDNRAMPLIRYATQDLAVTTSQAACPCGRALPLIESIQGRVPDIVMAPDGSALVVHFFTILFEYLPGIRQFQIVQEQGDRILARIVRGADYSAEAMEARIRDAVGRSTHGSLAVDFEYVPEIPLSRSHKRRFVVSKLFTAPMSVESPFEGSLSGAVPPEEKAGDRTR